jgi:hypothetical protein
VEGHLRIVGAGLDADVAAADPGVERVAGEGGQFAQRRRPPAGQVEAVVEEARSEADVTVRLAAGSPVASPVSAGTYCPGPSTAPPGSPRVIFSAAAVQRRNRSISSARLVLVTSKAAKASRSWAGVAMPAWWAPRNGITAGRAAGALVELPQPASATAPPAAATVPNAPARKPRRVKPADMTTDPWSTDVGQTLRRS